MANELPAGGYCSSQMGNAGLDQNVVVSVVTSVGYFKEKSGKIC